MTVLCDRIDQLVMDAATCWSGNGEPTVFPVIFREGAMA